MYDIIIIGSGAAGLTAAIYAKRASLNAVIIEKEFMGTGQIAYAEHVENYPGLLGLSGFDLGNKFREHAARLGAEFLEGEVTGLSKNNGIWTAATADGLRLGSRTVIFAAGTSHRRLDVPGGDKQKISFCAVCDGALYKDKITAVIGGGDTALGDALYLSKLAKTVYLIHRRNEFRANKTLQERVFNTENIITIMDAELCAVTGAESADGVDLTQNGVQKHLALDGIFAAIGNVPNSRILDGICALDESGFVVAGEDCRTTADGLFAAGDVRTSPLRQVITAAADGARAVAAAENYISEHNNLAV